MSRRRPRVVDDEQRAPLAFARPGDVVLDPSGGENVVLFRQGGRLMVADREGFRFILQSRRIAEGRWRHQAGATAARGSAL